jgi:O-antigen/teichoic acid export membrane protein
MEPQKRVIVNTGAQYTKAILNTLLSLYSTRLVLDALQVTDYGIYAVVGGVVAMLGFITNALLVTTQRYVSYYHGQGNSGYVKKIFSSSLFLHIVFAGVIALVLLLIKGWLFNDVLNIPSDRIGTARQVYDVTIAMLVVTILIAPFKALFIARENIVYISVVDVCDGIVKLLMAIGLAYVSSDRLIVYAIMMMSIQIMNLMVFAGYANWKFEECSILISPKSVDKVIMAQLMGFAGWTTYGTGAVMARTQGINIIINHFYGATANAAYGIAAQVNNAVTFVSSSIVNAMNPQIMKAEGEGKREHMLHLAAQESKYSVVLLSIVSIPIIMELPGILNVWLKDVPPYTVMFATFALAICLVDQFTIGLHAGNQAQGEIRNFTLIMFTPKLLNLPIAWILLARGCSLATVMWSVIIVEALIAVLRIPYMKRTAGLNILQYLQKTVIPTLPLIAMLFFVSWSCTQLFHFPLRFLLTMLLSGITGCITVWFFTFTQSERAYFLKLIHRSSPNTPHP